MKKVSIWERYITKEIGIEFKACLYFFAILFFYCVYRLCIGIDSAGILHMAEMILLAYIIGYAQVYLLWNFDEAETLGKKELFGLILCSFIYAGVSYLCSWFDRNIYVTLGFWAYVMFMYFCVFLIYKEKRRIDDKLLNHELDLFKAKQKDNI